MEEKRCGTCKHYRQHYIRYNDGRYFTTPHGHCVHPRLKCRSTGDKCCKYWKGKESDPE